MRGSGGLVGNVAVLQQPDLVIDSMAAATGAAVAAMGAADSTAAAQQGKQAAVVAAGADEPAGTAGESSSGAAAAATAAAVQEKVTEQQNPSTDSKGSAAGGKYVGEAKATDPGKGAAAAQAGRHPLQQRVCGSPAVDGCGSHPGILIHATAWQPAGFVLYLHLLQVVHPAQSDHESSCESTTLSSTNA